MQGALVAKFNQGMSVKERVGDIVKRPDMYYFNFHSLASWTHWFPSPQGICRGKMQFENADP